MIKNRIVILQISNKPITQILIRLISVVDLPKGVFTLYFNILPFYILHPLSENKNFCYKPQNNPSVTVLLNGVDEQHTYLVLTF